MTLERRLLERILHADQDSYFVALRDGLRGGKQLVIDATYHDLPADEVALVEEILSVDRRSTDVQSES